MTAERQPFIDVDDLMPQIEVQDIADFYGVPLPELKQLGKETRTRCFLQCGRDEETGDRALAINAEHPAKKWKCHQYGCGKGGNLVGMCNLLKPGYDGGKVQPQGKRFKEIAADLQAIAKGEPPSKERSPTEPPQPKESEPPKINVPLVHSENERARALTSLDQKFVVDVADMNPKASAYFRRRSFLTPEVQNKWRMGCLPHDVGGKDKSGGTMRSKIVYPILNEKGQVLTWFGRDPDYEGKVRKWRAGSKAGREPEKFHFVKGFQRGLELFGQSARRLEEPGFREAIRELGLIIVEGPNDVIRLDTLGVPAVGLCSNTISDAQVRKVVKWAQQLGGGRITLMLDCDDEGERGAKEIAWKLSQHCSVQTAWSSAMYDGRFRARQPESLSSEEWQMLSSVIARNFSEATVNEELYHALERLLHCPDLNVDELEDESRDAIQQAVGVLEVASADK